KLLEEIPQSAHFSLSIDDGETGDVISGSDVHAVQIFQPSSGNYKIVVTGISQGPFSLTVTPFSATGEVQSPMVVSGNIKLPGSSTTYQLTYDSWGSTPPIAQMLMGDRNGDGVVNCADLAIVKASFGKKSGQVGFDPRADANGDGVV